MNVRALIALVSLGSVVACERDAARVESSIPPEIKDYVQTVADAVRPSSSQPLEVAILPSLVAQSFAVGERRVVLTVGMLLLLQSEAELACVLGHEIAHHDLGDAAAEPPAQTEGDLPATNWSPDRELAADELALKLCSGAGYAPVALPHLLYRAGRTYTADAPTEIPPPSDTIHVLTRRALAAIETIERQSLLEGRHGVAEFAAFRRTLAGYRHVTLTAGPTGTNFFEDTIADDDWADLSGVYQEGKDASNYWRDEQCSYEGATGVPSNRLDAFGHCYYGCESKRWGLPYLGPFYEFYREGEEVLGIDDHDSFWQDIYNQSVGYQRGTAPGEEPQWDGSCYGICANALEDGDLALTAPLGYWWDCERSRTLPNGRETQWFRPNDWPDNARYVAYPTTDGSTLYGDPHLVTSDGLRYDFQAAGEFVALESTVDDFVVQIRLEPVAPVSGSRATALAANLGGTTVGVYLTQNGMNVTIGDRVSPPESTTIRLPSGDRIHRDEDSVQLVWVDGSRIAVSALLPSVDFSVSLTPYRARHSRGLFGNYDGDSGNEFHTRAGVPVTLPDEADPGYLQALYGVFGDSWRIGQEESLFLYEPGKTTSSYQRVGYPIRNLSIDDLDAEARDEALAACRAAGVQAEWLESCLFDVGVSGDESFAASSVRAALFPRHAPDSSGRARRVQLTVPEPGTYVMDSFSADEGDSFLFEIESSSPTLGFGSWALRSQSGETKFSTCVVQCNQPGLVLLEPGRYISLFEANKGEHGTLSVVRHIVPDPQEFDVALGTTIPAAGPAGEGNIESPGAVDGYRIQMRAGDGLVIAMKARDGSLYFGEWRMIAPNDEVLFSGLLPSAGSDSGEIIAVIDGTYLLEVTGGDSWPTGERYGRGTYSLHFYRSD